VYGHLQIGIFFCTLFKWENIQSAYEPVIRPWRSFSRVLNCRLRGWVLQLQEYDLTKQYKAGGEYVYYIKIRKPQGLLPAWHRDLSDCGTKTRDKKTSDLLSA